MSPDNTTKDPAAKRAAIDLLRRGLITKSEAAELAGVSRQLIQHWAKDVRVDENRQTVITRLWRKALARR
jgi:DNA-binding XRE family transcriptional regulator